MSPDVFGFYKWPHHGMRGGYDDKRALVTSKIRVIANTVGNLRFGTKRAHPLRRLEMMAFFVGQPPG